ncbi:hypothetical protein CDL15_Pgr004213 [Punica granatum]|uniref:RBR-type E3 ubiquitin transferase n=1 Tax=Punica granatum TaxID=22663 RepID=A0A218XHG0_PUNGR|nr:hypothetical protein CDL15_Pgr004213 [Punica granatum]
MDSDNGDDYNNDPHPEDEEFPECSQVVPPKTKSPSFQVIASESLQAVWQEDVRRVMELLSVKKSQARMVLIHNRWDLEKVYAMLAEKGASKLFAEAGVSIPKEDRSSHNNPVAESSTRYCSICMESMPENHMTRMDCGHCFCNNCWTENFIISIRHGKSRRIRCMEHECNSICDDSIIRSLVRERDINLAEKFERFILESYIEDNKMVKWCPRIPPCGNAIRVEDEDDMIWEVECPCGCQFCFGCLSEPHSPCTCSMWEMWAKLCDKSGTSNWKKESTKPCPKCHKLTQNDDGCDIVVCFCGKSFSWPHAGATGKEHAGTAFANRSSGPGRQENEEKSKSGGQDRRHFT